MKELKAFSVFVIGFTAFLFLIGLAGKADYTEYVIQRIPQHELDSIKKQIPMVSDNKIVELYTRK